jgi:hypothetical protein
VGVALVHHFQAGEQVAAEHTRHTQHLEGVLNFYPIWEAASLDVC